MASLVRGIGAGIAGVLAAFVTVAVVEAASHALLPRGAAPSAADRQAIAAYIAAMPVGAFLGIAFAWALAVLVGTWVAVAIARRRPRLYAGIVGGLIALSAVLNFVLVPHPAWFVAVGLAAVLVATFVAARVASRRRASTPDRH